MDRKRKKISEIYFNIYEEVNKSLDMIIKTAMTRVEKKPDYFSGAYLGVSTVAGMCLRKEALKLLDNDPNEDRIEDNLNLIFQTGNAFQDIVRDMAFAPKGYLRGMYMCKTCEYVHGSIDGEFTLSSRGAKEAKLDKRIGRPLECDVYIEGYGVCGGKEFEYIEDSLINHQLKVTGHIDGIIENKLYDHVLEIKTVNDNRYRQAKKEPFPEHLEQAMFYAWSIGKKSILLLYFNKNGGAYIHYDLPVDLAIIGKVIKRIKDFWAMIDEFKETKNVRELPPMICSSMKEQKAKYCEKCERCFNFVPTNLSDHGVSQI
jgi:hypothetical protein